MASLKSDVHFGSSFLTTATETHIHFPFNDIRNRMSRKPLLPAVSLPEALNGVSLLSSRSKVKHMTLGIFQLAYEAPMRQCSLHSLLTALRALRGPAPFAARLLRDLYGSAPTMLMMYIVGCIWLSIAPTISLYLANAVLGIFEESIHARLISDSNVRVLQIRILIWLFSALMTTIANRVLEDAALTLGGHLRAQFYPEFVKASLRLHPMNLEDTRVSASFPSPWGFGEGAPGWDIVREIFTRLRNILTIALEILVLIFSVSRKDTPNAEILAFFCFSLPAIMITAPSNALRGAGYVFWTNNAAYHRLSALHSMVFEHKYRHTLAKDGAAEYLREEYQRASSNLGVVKGDTISLACKLPPPWYWNLFRSLLTDYSLALAAIALVWSPSVSTLTTMVLVQHATTTLRQSINDFQGSQDPDSLAEILHRAQRFYEALHVNVNIPLGTADYPDAVNSSCKGMKLSFQNVSLRYMQQFRTAVDGASFDIQPGHLVVLCGVNGSGKSSLLSLVPRLMDPSQGRILIDDKPLIDYDLNKLRASIAFLSQTEEIYPISLRENLLMGQAVRRRVTGQAYSEKALLDCAALLGGSYDFIQRLGYDAVLNPVGMMGQSMRGCGNGDISDAVMRELELHSQNLKEIPISGGERQRLLATRTFMRLLTNPNIKLLVVDEPTSALDPVAERDILNRFCEMRDGKTAIFVTHRFGQLVKRADIILCMDGGKIVQAGTHTELMRDTQSVYAQLYKAQAEGFE